MPALHTCKFEEVATKIDSAMPRTRSNTGFFSTQEQVTLKHIVQYSRYSHLSKILCLSKISASLKNLRSKLKLLCPGKGKKYGLLQLSRASDSKMICTIWLIFKQVQDFMLVLNTCKFEEVTIRT